MTIPSHSWAFSPIKEYVISPSRTAVIRISTVNFTFVLPGTYDLVNIIRCQDF